MFYEPIITDEAQLILPVYDENTEKMRFFYAGFSDGDWKKAGMLHQVTLISFMPWWTTIYIIR